VPEEAEKRRLTWAGHAKNSNKEKFDRKNTVRLEGITQLCVKR